MNTKRKVQIFDACISAKLLYGLHAACLNQAERRRLDGFHARCLRRILKIAPSYYSRVSNATVWMRSRTQRLSTRLLQQQMHYFGKLALSDAGHPCREYVFETNSVALRRLNEVRRVGRPRLEWASEMYNHAVKAVSPNSSLTDIFQTDAGSNSLKEWRQHVYKYIDSM